MPQLRLSLMLAMSRMGAALVLFLVTAGLLYLAINGMRTGKTGTRSTLLTEKENVVRFLLAIVAYFFLALMTFVGFLVVLFAP